jgi:hypothetical protein
LIGTFIIAHIFYQEFDRFKRQDDSTFWSSWNIVTHVLKWMSKYSIRCE